MLSKRDNLVSKGFPRCESQDNQKKPKKNFISNFVNISVPYAIGPSVKTLRAQLNFPSKHNFYNLFEFPATKST
jgi:hypothetical protein